jgi:hypothetical protein
MRRAPNLTDGRIKSVVQLLDGWSGPLTWTALVQRVEKRLGARYTRQALHTHARIQQAFALRKSAIRELDEPKRRSEVQVLLDRLARLKDENQRLERENERLLEQFARWAFNAFAHGLGRADLDRPLPEIERK